ncbi:MAG: hypothetical protein ABI388_10230 [Bacteroidia bacterium]
MKKMCKKSVLLLLAAIFLLKISSTAQDIKLLAAGESCIYAIKNEGLFQVTNQGKKFKLIKAGQIEQLAVCDSAVFIFSVTDGFFLSTNHGVDWKKLNSPGQEVKAIAIYGNEIFVSGVKNTFISIDEGLTWNKIKSIPGSVFFAGAIGPKIFVSSSDGLYFSDGDRNRWQKCQGFEKEIFKGSIGVSSVISYGNLYYAGVCGYSSSRGLFVSDDKGLTWKRRGYRGSVKEGFDDHLFNHTAVRCLVSLNQTLLAGDWTGPVYTSNNEGNIWTCSNVGIVDHYYVSALAVLATDVYALVANFLYVSHNAGASWVEALASSNILSKNDSIKFENKNREYVLEFNNRLKTDSAIFQECQFFKNFPPGLKYLGPYATNGSVVIAGSSDVGFGIFKSIDGGANWKKVNKGFKLAGYQTPDATFIFGSGNRLFVGTSMFGLYYSDDNGESWTGNTDELPIGGLADLHNFLSMESMFKTDTVLHLVMETVDGDFISLDNGKTWKHSSGRTMADITLEIRRNIAELRAGLSAERSAFRQKEAEKYNREHPINYSDIPKTSTGPNYRALSQDRFMEKNNHRDSWISSTGAIHSSH